MKGFTLLKRGCPVCNGAKKDCRQSNQSGMVFCRQSSANPIGFIFRGLDKWGFGLWQPSEAAQAFAQLSRDEWQQEQQQQRLERERRQQQQIASQLSAADRHKYYSDILDQLPLRESERADLEYRGFTPPQIEADGYCSVEQWQEVLGSFASNLPGILTNGKLNSQPGCIFPVKNVDGLIVALSIRLRDGDNGRYRWLTSATKKNHQGATPHLNGELPLAVFEPSEYQGDAIWLPEGVGIKPSITRYRLGVPVVGASSGLFSSSPNTCKATLEKLSAKYQTRKLVIPVDAGDVRNSHVCQRWAGQFEFLRNLGYSISVAWWQQWTKDDPDIDELDDLSKIELVSPEIFSSWVEADNKSSTKHQSSSSNEYIPFANSEIKFRVKRKQEAFQESFPELHTEAGKEWLKLRAFTPDETIDSKYFYYEPPKEGEGLGANSGLGTGKSYYTNNDYIAEDDGAIFLGNRNTVIEQFVENAKERHNLTWYLIQQDLREGGRDDLRLIQDPQSKIISCIDSILYIQPQDAVGKKIVFDEVESTLKHLNYSTTAVSYRRQLCKQRLTEIIKEADSILLCDGNLKDITVRYIEKLSGKKIKKVKNLYKGNRGKVTYYVGSEKFKKDEKTNKWELVERRLNDYSLLLSMMMADSDPFIVGADSQEQLEAWDGQLKAKGRKTFRLDGTTSNSLESKKFIRNPAKYIYENGIDVVLYSPSADQGLSIDLKGYFKRGYFFFFGVVLTDTQIQFLGRLRDAGCHLHVYCQVKHKDANSINKGLLSEGLQKFFVECAKDCASLSLSDIDEESRSQRLVELAYKIIEKSNDIHYQYECQLLSMAYFEQNNLRNCLEYAMREAGWQVEVVTGSKVSTKESDEIRAANRAKQCEEISAAAPFTASEAKQIERSGTPKEEDKPRLARHNLVSRIPGIENKVVTHKKIVRVPLSAVMAEKNLQNLTLSESEMLSGQGLEGVHIPPSNSINSQGICGQNGVSSENLQNLTLSEAETLSGQGLEGVHIASSNSINSQGVCGQDGVSSENAQNLTLSEAETLSGQGLKGVHIAPNNSINSQGVCGQGESVDFVEVEQEVTRPIFDADFVKRVKFQDRQLISRLESQFLLRNPHIAKLIQQGKWGKKLALFQDENQVDGVKRINLTTYKSPYRKINTLLQMGFGYFLEPESSWTQHTPEAIAFWEQGKDPKIARQIGLEVGDSDVCKYIGRVLDSYQLKRESEKITLPSGERVRQYRLKSLEPISQAIYECVEQKILTTMAEKQPVLDWNKIIEKSPSVEVELTSTQSLEPVHIAPSNSINSQGVCGQFADAGSQMEQLIQALESCESSTDFAAVIQGSSKLVVEDAIVFSGDQPRRQQLTEWLNLPAKELEPRQNWQETIKVYGELLVEAFSCGVQAVKELLMPWASEERWGAMLEFELVAPEKMQELMAIAPDCFQWCDG